MLDPEQWKDYQIECCWPRRLKADEEQKLWFVMFNSTIPKEPQYNYKHMLRVALWPKETFAKYFDTASAVFGVDVSAWDTELSRNDTSNDCPTTQALAVKWYENCLSNEDGKHVVCNKKRDHHFLPTRLLDVRHASQTSQLRLICTADPDSILKGGTNYLTVSHCWGVWGASENPTLLGTNLNIRKEQGLSLNSLPTTFRDALKVAAWLSIDWIWIDCLCIIQDSKEDWLKEASMMDKVYQNAELNICADFGVDSRAGVFAERTLLDITAPEIQSMKNQRKWQMTMNNAFSWMNSAPSLSRAWIHRELQLARRILHFSNKELVWECCGEEGNSFASETMPGGAPFKRIFNREGRFKLGHAQSIVSPNDADTAEHSDSIHKLWISICEGLSSKSLTYPTDMPVILSSLAKEFQQVVPDDEHVAGLWRSTLPESLAWRTMGRKPHELPYIAPSWSWMSTTTKVTMAVRSRFQNKLPVADVMRIETEMEYDDPYGPLSKGVLHVEGYLRRLHFHFVTSSTFILSVYDEGEEGEQPRLRRIGPDTDDWEGYTCTINIDSVLTLDGQDFECYALFTTYSEWAQDLHSCKRELTCILLEEVVGKADTFQRIGTLDHISDFYSMKMRYEVEILSTTSRALVEDIVGHDPEDPPENTAEKTLEEAAKGTPRDSLVQDTISMQGQGRSSSDEEGKDSFEDFSNDVWEFLADHVRRTRWNVIKGVKEQQKKERDAKKTGKAYHDRGSDSGSVDEEGQRTSGALSEHQLADSVSSQNDVESEHDPTEDEQEDEGDDGDQEETPSESEELDDDDDSDDDWNEYSEYQDWRKEPFGPLAELIESLRILCGVAKPDREVEAMRIFDVMLIISKTPAFGQRLLPAEALYQFDDALDQWREEQGLFPELKRLKTKRIAIV